MAYKTLIFGTDDLYEKLKPRYDKAVKRGRLEIVDAVDVSEKAILDLKPEDFDLAIISSHENFYPRLKQLEALGVPRDRIIDGRVFMLPKLDFPRLLKEGIAYAALNKEAFRDMSSCTYPRVYSGGRTTVKLGRKSNFIHAVIHGWGEISVGSFTGVANGLDFQMFRTRDHDYNGFTTYPLTRIDWKVPQDYLQPRGVCKVFIGNDVWVGRQCIFKSITPDKPLVIGDGAVIASNSVVVKNVPPYAIVGGNPAKIIKYRFPPEIIEALLRIKWWDWSLDRIHDNFNHFKDIEKFIALNDRS